MTWAKQVEPTTPYVGRGRGSKSREQRGRQTTRAPLTPSARQADPIAALRHRCDWKALVTSAGHKRLPGQAAVWCERPADRVERLCHRRKSRVQSAPLFGKLNEPIAGLTALWTLGVRG